MREDTGKTQSDKRFISRLYKEHLQCTIKTNNSIEKMAKYLNRYFTKQDIQMENEHMKLFSTSSIIRDMQIKFTIKHGYTPIRMAKI